jgi:hypothetical protein
MGAPRQDLIRARTDPCKGPDLLTTNMSGKDRVGLNDWNDEQSGSDGGCTEIDFAGVAGNDSPIRLIAR